MNAKKVLCAVDFSPCGNSAFEHAVELARINQAKLVIVHVSTPPPSFVSGYSGFGAVPPHEPEPDSRLEALEAADANIKLERVHLVGLEGEAIVKYAAQNGCDLIVMGTHGHGGFTKLVLGSVADYVLRHAKCAVFVIKDRQRERQSDSRDAAAAV